MVFFYTPDKMMTTSSIVEFVSIGNDGGDTMTRVVYFAFVTRLAPLKKTSTTPQRNLHGIIG